ncbi:SMC-Scp complex subunit ScpB [Lentilactobacillus sp. SPB1-3]|uniref:SMC-Scp complex subunit ScpB n=1 Tax=Lentilactobacillus terminaliae TaxID=3003483 RepID=A0ACD5DC38_9LACO|nr:SMC-Scp complex subunit ScpB [Lentilactobacillus sp. SPB1-3]MCZ0977258.1 SMC-Scp complex subunit ScpB [Lentilactobacillus sp. SPB1-3]
MLSVPTDFAKMQALIYASGDEGISLSQIAHSVSLSKPACRQLLSELEDSLLKDENSGLMITVSDEVYRLQTKTDFEEFVADFIVDAKPRVLSQAALETIAIIMYNEPITRIEVDEIRGVNSSAIIHRLLNQGLIEVAGIKKEVGNPKTYRTTNYCLDYFGLKSKDELPELPKDEVLTEDTSDALMTRFNREIDSK